MNGTGPCGQGHACMALQGTCMEAFIIALVVEDVMDAYRNC